MRIVSEWLIRPEFSGPHPRLSRITNLWVDSVLSSSKHCEDSCGGIRIETGNCFEILSEDGFNLAGGAIAAADPDYFGWKAQNFAHFAEVGVLRDEGEPTFTRVIPQDSIGGPVQPNIEDVDRPWVKARW